MSNKAWSRLSLVVLLVVLGTALYFERWSPEARACQAAGGKMLNSACHVLVKIDPFATDSR